MTTMNTKQNKCPNCGKFVEYDADGYYDREWPYGEFAQVVQYCDESCCNSKQRKDANRSK